MPDQRVVLHVGLPKTGTTFLQGLLAANRDVLRGAGVLYPFVRPGAMFHGAVEVRGSHAKFGLAADEVAGTWQALCDRARAFPGTTILGHEVLGGASVEEVRTALAPLEGLRVEVVVTVRDLGRQATAHWQEEVKLGSTASFTDFERRELRGPREGEERPHFWHAQDWSDALRRWSVTLPVERVHLVVCPAPGAARDELWKRFAAAGGLAPDLLDTGSATLANPSLGTLQVAHLRQVNEHLAGRLAPGTYHRLVKRQYAEGRLAGEPGERPRTPASLADLLVPATEEAVACVRRGGYAVHGDLEELWPVLAAPGDPHPDDVDPDALAALGPARVAEQLVAEAGGDVASTGLWTRLSLRARRRTARPEAPDRA